MDHTPPQPANSIRITLQLTSKASRLDSPLMEALRKSNHLDLKNISRTDFKKLFNDKRILIKNQPARPSSSIAAGTTYVDILGFSEA
jgi:hypothetical protein